MFRVIARHGNQPISRVQCVGVFSTQMRYNSRVLVERNRLLLLDTNYKVMKMHLLVSFQHEGSGKDSRPLSGENYTKCIVTGSTYYCEKYYTRGSKVPFSNRCMSAGAKSPNLIQVSKFTPSLVFGLTVRCCNTNFEPNS